jgi:hypothetical protein
LVFIGEKMNYVPIGENTLPPNKCVQSDAAAAAGYQGKIGWVTRIELRRTSEKSRRG